MKLKDRLYKSIVKILVLLILANVVYMFHLLINLYFQEVDINVNHKIIRFLCYIRIYSIYNNDNGYYISNYNKSKKKKKIQKKMVKYLEVFHQNKLLKNQKKKELTQIKKQLKLIIQLIVQEFTRLILNYTKV